MTDFVFQNSKMPRRSYRGKKYYVRKNGRNMDVYGGDWFSWFKKTPDVPTPVAPNVPEIPMPEVPSPPKPWKYRIADWFQWGLRKAGDAAVKGVDTVEPTARVILWETLRAGLKAIWHGPALSFLTLCIANPAAALQLALKAASLTLSTIQWLAFAAKYLYSWLSPSEREKRRVAGLQGIFQNIDLRLYLEENVELAQKFKEDKIATEIIANTLGLLMDRLCDPESKETAQFIHDFRERILQGDLTAQCMRVALTQVTTIQDEKTGKYYYKNFNWKAYKAKGKDASVALQSLVTADFQKNDETMRQMARIKKEIIDHIDEKIANLSEVISPETTSEVIEEAASETSLNPELETFFMEKRIQGLKRSRDQSDDEDDEDDEDDQDVLDLSLYLSTKKEGETVEQWRERVEDLKDEYLAEKGLLLPSVPMEADDSLTTSDLEMLLPSVPSMKKQKIF